MSPQKSSKQSDSQKRSTGAAAPRGRKAPGGAPDGTVGANSDADDASAEVFEFVRAIDAFKRAQGKPFPTWTEVLEVLKGLGYTRQS